MLIRAVLFDYGDTLIVGKKPDQEIIPEALKESFRAFKKNGVDMNYQTYVEQDMRVFRKYAEMEKAEQRDIPDRVKYVELLSVLCPELPAAKRRRIASEANTAFWNSVTNRHTIRKGTKTTLSELRRMGLRMAVISNHHNPDSLRGHLRHLGISSYFSRVLASSELPYRKPDPRIFRMCASELMLEPTECVFVGDSVPFDIAGANGVGMLTILIRNGRSDAKGETSKPDFAVQDLREIPDIVKKANS